MMQTIGLGVIGCGGRLFGLLKHLQEHEDGFAIRAICDPAAAAVEKTQTELAGGEATVYDDYRELVKDPRVQWVWIGSWNCFHAAQAIAAMEAGKDVYCEKPLATTLEDCLAMRDVQRRTGRRFTIGFTLRYAAMYFHIREQMEAGKIGRLVSMEFNENVDFHHGAYIHRNWRRKREYAGTHLLEKCCHDIDVANWLVGARARRAASFAGLDFFTAQNAHRLKDSQACRRWPEHQETPFRDDKDIIDNQVAIIEYANDVRATFQASCNAAIPERRMYLLGEDGAIRADLLTGKVETRRHGEESEFFDTIGGGHGGGDTTLISEVAAAMRDGQPPRVGLKEGLESAVTCFAIDEAADTGTVVSLADYWRRVDEPPSD